jgi:hypothetical protein
MATMQQVIDSLRTYADADQTLSLRGLSAFWEPIPARLDCTVRRPRGHVPCELPNDHDGVHTGRGRDGRYLTWPDVHGGSMGRLRARQRRVETALDGGQPLAWLLA